MDYSVYAPTQLPKDALCRNALDSFSFFRCESVMRFSILSIRLPKHPAQNLYQHTCDSHSLYYVSTIAVFDDTVHKAILAYVNAHSLSKTWI